MEQDFGSYFSIAPLFLILSLMATLDLLRLLIFCLKHGIKTSCVQTPWEVMIISKLIHGWQLGILIFFSSKSYEYRFRGFSQICLKGKLWLIEVSKSLRGEGTVGELTLGVFSRDGSLGIGKWVVTMISVSNRGLACCEVSLSLFTYLASCLIMILFSSLTTASFWSLTGLSSCSISICIGVSLDVTQSHQFCCSYHIISPS